MTKCENLVPPYAEMSSQQVGGGMWCWRAEPGGGMFTGSWTITLILNIFGTRYPFCGRQFFYKESRGGDGSGGNASDREHWGGGR